MKTHVIIKQDQEVLEAIEIEESEISAYLTGFDTAIGLVSADDISASSLADFRAELEEEGNERLKKHFEEYFSTVAATGRE